MSIWKKLFGKPDSQSSTSASTTKSDVGKNAPRKMSKRPTPSAVYCPLCDNQMPEVAWSIFLCKSCQIAFAGLLGNYSTSSASVAEKCRNVGYSIIEKNSEKGTDFIIDC